MEIEIFLYVKYYSNFLCQISDGRLFQQYRPKADLSPKCIARPDVAKKQKWRLTVMSPKLHSSAILASCFNVAA